MSPAAEDREGRGARRRRARPRCLLRRGPGHQPLRGEPRHRAVAPTTWMSRRSTPPASIGWSTWPAQAMRDEVRDRRRAARRRGSRQEPPALPALPLGERADRGRRPEGLLRLPAQHPRRPRSPAPLPAQVRRQPALGGGPAAAASRRPSTGFVDRAIRHAIESACPETRSSNSAGGPGRLPSVTSRHRRAAGTSSRSCSSSSVTPGPRRPMIRHAGASRPRRSPGSRATRSTRRPPGRSA